MEIQIDSEYALDCVNLNGNPIEKPPLEVVRQGNKAIQNYYSQMELQGKDYLFEAKMLIVGEGESGKTTLSHKVHNADCALPHIDDRTRGITIKPYHFKVNARDGEGTRPFQLNVWDFGGQEIYHATHRFFLSKRSLYVLVADNRKDDTDFNYWLNIIELFAGDSPMIILLNEKGDVQRSINIAELRGRYPESIKEVIAVNFKTREESDEYIRRKRLQKIEKLKSHIEHNAYCLPHIGEPLPALWLDVREAIENGTRNCIYREEFDDICRKHKITGEQDITTLLGYFHDLGVVLHFDENPLLRNRVILKPFWATNAVYRIFDNDGIKAKEGRFRRNDCIALWNGDEYRHMHDLFMELMKNFQLAYEIDQTGNMVAPQMLPQDTPDYNWATNNNLLMQYRYDKFMPKGIFSQFAVKMNRYIANNKWIWRNGVIQERDGTQAEIIENLFDRRIYIRFAGPNIAEFRAIITDTLDEISNSYHKLQYEKMIPCNCSVCSENKVPHFFRFSALRNRLQKGIKATIECEISAEDVLMLPLLEGLDIGQMKGKYEDMGKRGEWEKEVQIKTVKIFLASSSELSNHRKEFEIFIRCKNDEYGKKGIYLKLTLWEDFPDAMSQTRLQDEYNKAVADSDVFVSLFHTKVGKYTEEEFQKALETFKENGRPLVYTYFNDTAVNISDITQDVLSLLNFKKRLNELGHFPTSYTGIDDLKNQFSDQMTKFIPKLTGV